MHGVMHILWLWSFKSKIGDTAKLLCPFCNMKTDKYIFMKVKHHETTWKAQEL